MRSISMCWPGCCSPPSNLPAPTKRRRGARRGPPSFKDAAERLAEALAATREAEAKLAQERRRVEAAQRRTDTREWAVARRERTRHLDRKSTRMNASH